MRRTATALLLTVFVAAPGMADQPQKLVALAPPPTDLSSLLVTYPKGGEGLAQSVADALVHDPAAAPAVARLGKSINCDQATAIAVGVSRATKQMQDTAPDAIPRVYDAFAATCSGCRPRYTKSGPAYSRFGGPISKDGPRPDDERCARPLERSRLADVLKVRSPQGEDCLCALVSGLAAQAYAQAANGAGRFGAFAGSRMGFFPDEGGFSGGGGFNGIGRPITGN